MFPYQFPGIIIIIIPGNTITIICTYAHTANDTLTLPVFIIFIVKNTLQFYKTSVFF